MAQPLARTASIRRAAGTVAALAAFCAAGGLGTPGLYAAPREAADGPGTRAALQRGVAFLLEQQNKHKTWEPAKTPPGQRAHEGGQTALATWTLLQLGEALDDPRLQSDGEALAPAIAYLTRLEPRTTYAAAMQAMVLARLPLNEAGETRKAAERARGYLLAAMRSDGGYSYTAEGKEQSSPDNANAAYALYAMAALHDAGIEPPASHWVVAEKYWRARQKRDGGWSYDEQLRPGTSGGMTAAGVRALEICAGFRTLRDMAAATQKKPSATMPLVLKRDLAVSNRLTVLAGEFDPDSRDYFFLYQLQRAAGDAGLSAMGKKNIFRESARALRAAQKEDGSWSGEFAEPAFAADHRLVSTCYALLTLAGTVNPVAFAKLEYPPVPEESLRPDTREATRPETRAATEPAVTPERRTEGRWDARPRDVANLTDFLSRAFSRPLRWQALSSATPAEEDTAAPVLVITGTRDPALTDAQLARIKAFIEGGGLVLSAADGGDAGAEFSAAMARLAPALTGRTGEFRPLPPTHPIFDIWQKIGAPPKVLGLSNGVRELWLHVPIDLGASWQAGRGGTRDHFVLAANVHSYITGKGAPWPGAPRGEPAPATTRAAAARNVAVARILYAGNADPEPGAWRRFTQRAESFRTQLTLLPLRSRDLDAAKTPVAHLTGTDAFALDADDKAGLKKFIDAGGVLLIDHAGGGAALGASKPADDKEAPPFVASVKALLAEVAPGGALATIPRNDLLYNGSMRDSVRIAEVTYRPYTTLLHAMDVAPRLQGISRNGRWVVVFSADDLTSGLLETHTWGISGYSPRSATAIVRNVVLYGAREQAPGEGK